MNNPNILSEIKKNIYIKNDSILNHLQQYNELKSGGLDILEDRLYNSIINVGEFTPLIKEDFK